MLFDGTDDSPQYTTGTTYDFNKQTDEIIDLVEDEPQKRNTRRERHVEEEIDDPCPVTQASQRNIRREADMETFERTSTRSSTIPFVYDGRRRKEEDEDLREMGNIDLKYYTPQTRSNSTQSDGTPSGVYQRRGWMRGIGAKQQ